MMVDNMARSASGVTSDDSEKRRKYITDNPIDTHHHNVKCIAFAILLLVGGSLLIVFIPRKPTAAKRVSVEPSLQPSKSPVLETAFPSKSPTTTQLSGTTASPIATVTLTPTTADATTTPPDSFVPSASFMPFPMETLTSTSPTMADTDSTTTLVPTATATPFTATSPQPPSRFDDIVNFMSPILGITAFNMTTNPQTRAAQWMANDDGLALSVDDASFVQRFILTTLYFAWAGEEWRYTANFLTSNSECTWFETQGSRPVGITCAETGQVVAMDLSSNKLNGTFLEEIVLLTSLETINLAYNKIRGTLPTNLGNMSNLKELYMIKNSLSSTIPESIGSMVKLEKLSLSANNMTGLLPQSMTRLTNLAFLQLDDNAFSGTPEPLYSLPNLQYIYLENNLFVGSLENAFVWTSDKTIELDLSNNAFQGTVPSHFLTGPMQILDLSRNLLTGTLPDVIKNDNLKLLSLYGNAIGGTIPKSISTFPTLNDLDLSLNNFTGNFPSELFNMTSLEYLFLTGNNFNPGSIPDLSGLGRMRELALRGTQRIGRIPDGWESQPDLQFLDLSENELTGELPESIGGLEKLSFLLLNRNQLSGQVPPSYLNLTQLTLVFLDHNDLVGSAASLCGSTSTLLVTDCILDCICCSDCCDDEFCNGGIAPVNMDPRWEDNFDRTTFDFNGSFFWAR